MANNFDESSSWGTWIIVGLIGATIIIIGWLAFANSPASKTTREVVESCTTDMATQFHIHPTLKIVINGQEQEIPADIGIVAGCMRPLHTHDSKGIIHVESPVKRDFTLGDFFFVWGKAFSKDQIFDFMADEKHAVRMTVNGQESPEFEHLILRDEDAIIISYEQI